MFNCDSLIKAQNRLLDIINDTNKSDSERIKACVELSELQGHGASGNLCRIIKAMRIISLKDRNWSPLVLSP